jgi:hypothetical protein
MILPDGADDVSQYFDGIDQQNARTLGQIVREEVTSSCKLGPAVSHTIILPAFVGVRKLTPTVMVVATTPDNERD